MIVAAPDGSLIGRAVYDAEARSGAFFALGLAPGDELVRATVDGEPARPMLAGDDRWLIPIGERAGRIVTAVWNRKAGRRALSAERADLVPRAGTIGTPLLVRIYTPEGQAVRIPAGGLEVVGPEQFELARAEIVSRRVTTLLAEMDRGSGRDLDRLAALLIDHESALRSAAHAASRSSRNPSVLDAVAASRAAVIEAARAAGVDEAIDVADAYLGRGEGARRPPIRDVPEPVVAERIRRLGEPTCMVGVAPGLEEPPIGMYLTAAARPWVSGSEEDRTRTWLFLVLMLGLGAASLAAGRLAGLRALMIAAGLALSAVAGGPIALASCATAAAYGWLSRGVERPAPPSAAGIRQPTSS